jgi:EAL domain-containing protein (putative c-di-GMP-specific phosphodiesterase class I)
LREIGLPSSAMAVEVRESSLMETPSEALDSLKTLHSGGIQISLDDFGSGCSSLSNLNQYPIDMLKIDRSFIRRLSPHSRDRPMAEAIIAMAHKLGINVVAEGLETEQQRDFLSDMGCDYGQGYYFSKPLPADEFSRVLSTRP